MSFSAFLEGTSLLFGWPLFGWMLFGVVVGIFFGALPGVGSNLGIAISIPLTIPLEPLSAIIFLIGIYSGAAYGGSVASILINVPGSAANAATTIDGYPMSKQGKAIDALSIGAVASVLGGSIAVITLIVIAPVITLIVLAFGSAEYFLIAILGIAMIAIVTRQGSLMKGIVTGMFGFLLTTIGFAPLSGDYRYVFGRLELSDGISFIAVLLGLFAVAEMVKLSTEMGGIAEDDEGFTGSRKDGLLHVLRNPVRTIKSSYIGMGIGAVPGAGAATSNFVSYVEELRSSDDDPDSYGQGNPNGVLASEAANNGTVAGSLVPTLAFGIPGSGSTALLLGALLLHGLRPGPMMFSDNIHLTYAMFVGLLIGNVVIILLGLTLITSFGDWFTRIDTNRIIPIILVLCVLGTYSLRNNWLDVITVVGIGIFGYYWLRYNFPIIPFVLGVVLGPIAEENLFRSMQISGWDPTYFLTRPLSVLLIILTLLILFGPVIKTYWERETQT